LNGWILYRKKDESDERDASDAVGFKAVSAGANGVAGVVTSAIGDDAGLRASSS
jgi:hypothetical protein